MHLLGDFVHEMRNQLAPIAHAGDALALLREAPAPVRNAALSIQRQGRQVSRLLDRMALAARIFVPDFTLDLEPVALEDLLADVVRDFATLHGGRVEVLPHAARLSVRASREHLSWTLLEVLEMSAARREPEFGLLLRVLREGDTVVLAVGEARDEQAVAPASRGAALGVRCATRLAELMGGALVCGFDEQAAADGFRLTLASAAPAELAASDRLHGATRRVLVVDDNRALCDSLLSLVDELGHVARAACTGLDAMSIAILWEPDLVLIDVNLAGTNGYDVALRLRSEFPESAMKIHMMSGDASGEALAREARRRGLDGFVGKMECGAFLHRALVVGA
ncbi:MAG: response regulator [Gammaproteobacteria bacterium]